MSMDPIPEVLTELNALEAERSPAKRLLLSLLEAKSVLQINENEELRHTDDILFQMACELQCAPARHYLNQTRARHDAQHPSIKRILNDDRSNCTTGLIDEVHVVYGGSSK